MTAAMLVTWTDSNDMPHWHICRGYAEYDAFNVYTMWAARQTDETLERHETKYLGIEDL